MLFDYIFIIDDFNKLTEANKCILTYAKNNCKKLIIGIYADKVLLNDIGIKEHENMAKRKNNIKPYVTDIFVVNNINSDDCVKKYMATHFTNENSIKIGKSDENTKLIPNIKDNEKVFFYHKHKDIFSYTIKNNILSVTRTDSDKGWGQNLIGYKRNWCFICDYNDKHSNKYKYILSIMGVKYTKTIMLEELLSKITNILFVRKIPYYIDCGTLLGCIRQGCILDHDTDIDITTHLSLWNKLNSIDFKDFGLIRTRTYNSVKKGFLISLKTPFDDNYCNIYANPAFPLIEKRNFLGRDYFIPKDSGLYLTQLYGDLKKPSDKRADWPKFFYNGLVTGPYSKYWDLNYPIQYNSTTPQTLNQNLNKIFWDSYYKNTSDKIDSPSSFAEYIHINFLDSPRSIIDLGAGNCRDSIYFSSKGHKTTAIDYNGVLNSKSTGVNLIKEDVEIILKDKSIKCDVVYMRWFLHAMPYEKAENIFKLVSEIKDVLICIELRSLNDTKLVADSVYDSKDKSYKTTHKRWLYTEKMLEDLCIKYDCKIIESKEGYFSPNTQTETNNPLLIRGIYQKIGK